MDAREYIARIKACAQGILSSLRPREPISHTGVGRRNVAPPEPIPADPVHHAEDFALRYYEPLEGYSRRRMRELGIPDSRIGAYDIDFEFRHAAFFPRSGRAARIRPGPELT